MKIIDLLNKIANGEEVPERVKFDGNIYEYDEDLGYVWYEDLDNMNYYLANEPLNEKVEIIEDTSKEEKKIPEKLNKKHFHKRQRQLANKINEIIDYLQYLKNKGE